MIGIGGTQGAHAYEALDLEGHRWRFLERMREASVNRSGAAMRPPDAFRSSEVAGCTMLLALCLIESVWLAAVPLFLLGYTGVITWAGCQTSLQLLSSDELRKRVMSLFTLIHGGCFPIAGAHAGALGDGADQGGAFFVWGAGGLSALALLMGDRRGFDRGRSTLVSAIDMKAATE